MNFPAKAGLSGNGRTFQQRLDFPAMAGFPGKNRTS
jgi:hypothetical protein